MARWGISGPWPYIPLAQQMLKSLDWPAHYATADEPVLKGPDWIEQQWEVVRTRLKSDAKTRPGLLILDEVQNSQNSFLLQKKLFVGNQGIPLEEFLLTPVEALF